MLADVVFGFSGGKWPADGKGEGRRHMTFGNSLGMFLQAYYESAPALPFSWPFCQLADAGPPPSASRSKTGATTDQDDISPRHFPGPACCVVCSLSCSSSLPSSSKHNTYTPTHTPGMLRRRHGDLEP
nr:hypothetical protein CFP56_21012 [Quercus suber]